MGQEGAITHGGAGQAAICKHNLPSAHDRVTGITSLPEMRVVEKRHLSG